MSPIEALNLHTIKPAHLCVIVAGRRESAISLSLTQGRMQDNKHQCVKKWKQQIKCMINKESQYVDFFCKILLLRLP